MAPVNYGRALMLSAFVIVTWNFVTWESRQTWERPIPAIVWSILLSAIAALVLNWHTTGHSSTVSDYAAIPLEDRDETLPQTEEASAPSRSNKGHSMPSLRRSIIIINICLALRIETLRRISNDYQCSAAGIEFLVPVLLAVYDYVTVQRFRPVDEDEQFMSNNIFDDLYDTLTDSRFRYLGPVVLLCWGGHLAPSTAMRSTYICPRTLRDSHIIPAYQLAGVLLDTILVITAWSLFDGIQSLPLKRKISARVLGSSALVLLVVGGGLIFFGSALSANIFDLRSAYFWDASFEILGYTLAWLVFDQFVNEVSYLTGTVLFTFCYAFMSQLKMAWNGQHAFPTQSDWTDTFAFIFVFLGFASYMHVNDVSEISLAKNFARRIPSILYFFLILLTASVSIFWLVRTNAVGFHPIDYIMYQTRTDTDRWLKQASSSATVRAATTEYIARYGRSPPPNFDEWFDFARARKTVIVDDYDHIEKDMLPFWGVDPKILRMSTEMLIRSEKHNSVGISIRSGNAEGGKALNPEDQWVVDETASLIDTFAEWLPDMDIAINLDNEPRNILPWKQINGLRKSGQASKGALKPDIDHGFSKEMGSAWDQAMKDVESGNSELPTGDMSIKNRRLIAHSCPPSSQIKSHQNYNKRDFCGNCVFPHSLGQFIHNWTLASDLCNQPDLPILDDFLLSFASEKTITHTLMPIFSRSKVTGFTDILFPWPGHYASRLPPDPWPNRPFEQMDEILFWRGPASDAVNSEASWKGLQHQRLVHQVNNLTSKDHITVVLPRSNDPNENKWKYAAAPATEITPLLPINAGLTSIPSCGSTCGAQKSELGVFPEIRFEDHYSNRYLLTLDSHGPSDKFLNFLRSNSVPFRSSIFREWYDDRITPWLHFVPIDERFQALHSTLAYFTGLRGKIGGREVNIAGKVKEAQFVAEQGKRWAEKTVRREDAEVYMFRLLLEWGRVVDERRGEIGFDFDEFMAKTGA